MKSLVLRLLSVATLVAVAGQAIAADQKSEVSPAASAAIGQAIGGGTLVGFDEAEVQKYPWGWIRWLMNGKIDPKAEMTLGIVHIEPNQMNPAHVHPNSAEYLHVLSGSCDHWLGGRWTTMKVGDTLRIPKGEPHRARTGKEACRVLVVYDTPERQMVVVEEEKKQ